MGRKSCARGQANARGGLLLGPKNRARATIDLLQLLERLHCILECAHLPLQRTPGKTLGSVIRWLPNHQLKANRVPSGLAGFELIDPVLFKQEVFPQGGSSSFRKFAKDWGLLSPMELAIKEGMVEKGNGRSQRKISYKCMYLPAAPEEGAVAMDPSKAFRRNGAHRTIDQVEAYAEQSVKPIDDTLSVRLPPQDMMEDMAGGSMDDRNKWAVQATLPGRPPQMAKPKATTTTKSGGGLRWSAMNIL